MKRLRLLLIAAAMMAAFFITPASALEYTFDSPSTGDFGTPTSAEDIIRERENPNTDKSKNECPKSRGIISYAKAIVGKWLKRHPRRKPPKGKDR